MAQAEAMLQAAARSRMYAYIVTELIYRKQIRPVMRSGAEVMDRIFGADPEWYSRI